MILTQNQLLDLFVENRVTFNARVGLRFFLFQLECLGLFDGGEYGRPALRVTVDTDTEVNFLRIAVGLKGGS